MYIQDTTLAPEGSGRETKIVNDLVIDIACTIALHRQGEDSGDREYQPEAERLLRLFIAKEGRYPHDALEVEGWLHRGALKSALRFASCEVESRATRKG